MPVHPTGAELKHHVLVRCPSRAAFSQMVADPADHTLTHLRAEAVSGAGTPWS